MFVCIFSVYFALIRVTYRECICALSVCVKPFQPRELKAVRKSGVCVCVCVCPQPIQPKLALL